jgi:hypothetical protein
MVINTTEDKIRDEPTYTSCRVIGAELALDVD